MEVRCSPQRARRCACKKGVYKPTPLRDPNDPPASSHPGAPRHSNFPRTSSLLVMKSPRLARLEPNTDPQEVGALPETTHVRHEAPDRKIWKETVSPEFCSSKSRVLPWHDLDAGLGKRGRHFGFRLPGSRSCVALCKSHPVERKGRICWRSARPWHDIFKFSQPMQDRRCIWRLCPDSGRRF